MNFGVLAETIQQKIQVRRLYSFSMIIRQLATDEFIQLFVSKDQLTRFVQEELRKI